MNLHSLLKAGAAILAVLLVSAGIASAHPHVWVTVPDRGGDRPQSGNHRLPSPWTFDEMYTSSPSWGSIRTATASTARRGYSPLAQTNIEALKEFEYFTFAFLGKDRLQMKDPPADYRLNTKTSS